MTPGIRPNARCHGVCRLARATTRLSAVRDARPTMLTQQELEIYERDGAVTVDGPLSPNELDEPYARCHATSDRA